MQIQGTNRIHSPQGINAPHFSTKMAGAQSVRDIRTMYQECGQHQLDFLRRDTERLFRHGERVIAATSNLISGRTPN